MRTAIRRALLKVRLAWREVSALSPRTVGAIAVNTLTMTVRDAQWKLRHRAPRRAVSLGKVTGATPIADGAGLAVTFERGTLHVHALSDSLVRIAWGPGRAPIDVATRDADLDSPTDVRVDVAVGGTCALVTARARVEVDHDGVRVLDTHGRRRYEELLPLAKGTRRVLRRVLREGERVCGLGEQARALDLTGGTHRLWNRDPGGTWGPGQDPLYCAVPVTVGLHPTGPVWTLHEVTVEATVTVGAVPHASHGVQVEAHDGALVTYVALGELDEVLTTAVHLTGRPAMPPRWALGYHHSRWGWRTDAVVARVLDGFRARNLPISALHLDIDHMDDFGVFTFDADRFGRVDELAASAAEGGTRLVAIVDPAVRRDDGFELYREGVEGGHFLLDGDGRVAHGAVWPGWAAFPDFTSASTRSWWASKYASLTSRGIAGIWHDMNEPTSITLWGDHSLPRSLHHDLDGRGGDHAEAHNVYGLYMDRVAHEALAKDGTRPFVLSRSGWASVARWAWHWTADVESSAEGLAQQVPTFLGLGLSSIPFTGSDIGGFTGTPSPGLYVRWLELGVLSPLCRTHCAISAPDREPWSFPAPFDAAVAQLIRLRYRLLPHLYRLAEEAHRLGHPLLRPTDWPVRPLGTWFDADASTFLLGNELLVVPVADPDQTSARFEVPPGAWRRLRLCTPVDGTIAPEDDIPGGAPADLDTLLGQPLVLQRAGTVVVLDDGWLDDAATLDAAHATRRWTLHVCLAPDGTAAGVGYDDDGDGEGPTRRDDYRVSTQGTDVVVEWASEGTFRRPGATGVVVHGRTAMTAEADGRAVDVISTRDTATATLDGPFERLTLRGA